jgi:hypothetical protein
MRFIVPRKKPCDHCPRVEVSGVADPVQTQPAPAPAPAKDGIPWGAIAVGGGILVGLFYLMHPDTKITVFKPKMPEEPKEPPPPALPT